MKKFLKKIILYFFRFIEVNLSIKVRNRTTPIDLYYENLSKDCYEFFKEEMQNSSIFLKPKDIRNFAISKSLKNIKDTSNLFLEFGVFKGESINFFADILKKKN